MTRTTRDSVSRAEDAASVQQEMFKTLLRCPHRQVDEHLAIHAAQFERDPNFYGRLAVNAIMRNGCTIRDVNEVFLAVLFNSPFQEHRDAAYVMLQSLPPYQVSRVMRYFTGYEEIVKHQSIDAPLPSGNGITIQDAVYSAKHRHKSKRGKKVPVAVTKLIPRSKLFRDLLKKQKIKASDRQMTVTTYLVKHACLNKKWPRGAIKRAIERYLRIRERDRCASGNAARTVRCVGIKLLGVKGITVNIEATVGNPLYLHAPFDVAGGRC